jgi:hypothetical protein
MSANIKPEELTKEQLERVEFCRSMASYSRPNLSSQSTDSRPSMATPQSTVKPEKRAEKKKRRDP